MLLSTQLFDRIAGISAGTGNDSQSRGTVLPVGCRRATERRATTRLAYGHRTQICRDSGKKAGVWDTIMLQDISLQGIGCLSDDMIESGSTFVLKLVDKQGETIRIRCKVCRCERGGFGNTAYLMGATFEHVIQQVPLRINDEPGDQPRWQDKVETEEYAVNGNGLSGKTGNSVMARMAVNLLRAVTPRRAASQWMRKSDDFS